jgi:hypothetical protein
VTRAELERWAKRHWEEAYAHDPVATEEATRRILGRDVFVWSTLPIRQLHQLSRTMFVLAILTRG